MPRTKTTVKARGIGALLVCTICLIALPALSSEIDEDDPTTWPRELLLQAIEANESDHEFGVKAQYVQSAHARINGDQNCRRALEFADRAKREMTRLNEDYAPQFGPEYERKFTDAKQRLSDSETQYRQCVVRVLYDSGLSKQIKVSTVDGLTALTDSINSELETKGVTELHQIGVYVYNLEQYGEELQAALKSLDENIQIIATIAGTLYGEVKSPGLPWRTAEKGMELKVNDVLRTGERGKIRIEFRDRDNRSGRGPTIGNIGRNSVVEVVSLQIKREEKVGLDAVLSLLRGSLRAFTANWGRTTPFSVRTGTALCGIRGTEVTLQYDPDSDVMNAMVDHGALDITTPTGTTSLYGKQKVSVIRGETQFVTHLTDSDWAEAVRSTPDIGELSLEAIALAESTANRQAAVDELTSSGNLPGSLTGASSGNSLPAKADFIATEAWEVYHQAMQSVVRRDFNAFYQHLSGPARESLKPFVEGPKTVEQLRQAGTFPDSYKVRCVWCTDLDNCNFYTEADTSNASTGQRSVTLYLDSMKILKQAAGGHLWRFNAQRRDILRENFETDIGNCPWGMGTN